MALLNNLYIFVESEDLAHDIESTSHPVEKGVEITDHIQRKAVELSLKGKIVSYNGKKASDILAQIKQLQLKGSLITYVGRNTIYNVQIQSLSTSHPNTNWGGCDFSMSLKEIRIAKPAYTETKNAKAGTQQVDKGNNNKVYHTVKKGDCCWNLVTKQYKNLVFYDDGEPIKNQTTMEKCNEIMALNPHAFSRKGDFRTLQIGAKIFVGFRE